MILLNETLFLGLKHAREKIGAWGIDYNHRRPQSSFGHKTPSQYAAKLNATGDRLRNPEQVADRQLLNLLPWAH